MSNAAVFDSNYYLSNNADVVVAISQGHFANALDHFNQFGGKELRAPNATFNPQYYAINNSDVLNAVSSGVFANVFAHFQAFGETENRAPNVNLASFDAAGYLAANADVAAAVTAGSFASALDHFIQFGQNESRSGSGVTEAANPGQTFALTTSTDAIEGTANGDTINASLITEGGVANQQSLGALDSIDGGAGIDTLNFTYNTAVTPLSIANVEKIVLQDADAGSETIDFVNVTGVTDLSSIAAGGAVDVNNVNSLVNLSLKNQAVNVDIDYTNTVISGGSDVQNLTVEGVTSGDITIDGVEEVKITSNGTGTNNFDINDTATTLAKLTIEGSANITIGSVAAALEAAVVTVDAATATGNVSVNHGTNAAVVTMTGGSGNDTFILDGTYVGGASGATRDTINGGDGTDTVQINSAAITASQANLTNIEELQIANALAHNIDLTQIAGATTLDLLNATIGAQTITVNSGSNIKAITGDHGDNARSFVVTGTGTDDSITITTVAGSDFGTATQTFTGLETVNVNSGTTAGAAVEFGAAVTITNTAGGSAKLVLTGVNSFDLNGAVTADEIDASGMTGNGILDMTGSSLAGAGKITGTANNDIITGSSGADILVSGNGADTITSGGGADVVTMTETTQADDTLVLGAEAIVSVTGFDTGASQDQIDIDVSAFNTDNLSDSTGTKLVAATAAGLISYTVGNNAAANATASNILFVTNTTGINGIADVNTALGNNNLTLDGGGTAFANGEGLLTVFYDANDSKMVLGYLEDSASGTAGVYDGTGSTFVEFGNFTMTAAEYAAIDATNFDFI